tara:strand:+ start:963 stop:1352 length:390 start_codon:yes stop_codon:yes gene_type:complete
MNDKLTITIGILFLSLVFVGFGEIFSINEGATSLKSEREQYKFTLAKNVKSLEVIGRVESYSKHKKYGIVFIVLDNDKLVGIQTSLDHINKGTIVSFAPSTNKDKYRDTYCLSRNEKTVCGWSAEVSSI